MFKTKLAKENWQSKYQYDNESPLETFKRVAKTCASVENEKDRDYWEDLFLKALVKFDNDGNAIGLKNTFGGRITANIGTDYKATTLLNCFINGAPRNAEIKYTRSIPGTELTIDNTINTQNTPDSLANIMLAVLEQAETLKSEGGYGINFDFIRPRGSVIEGIGIEHPGVVKYMEIWDKVSDVIVSGNTDGYKDIIKNYNLNSIPTKKMKKMARKGAMMGCLSVSHPDIEEFIRAKQQPGKLTKFNISVVVDDEFMIAVESDEFYNLKFNNKVYKTVKARELYELIMQSTYNRAEPGILFYDAMQRNNPLSYLGPVDATNPCQPESAELLTKNGITKLGDINVGDEIWSEDGWVFVTNKWSTGVKPVYKYNTTAGYFLGTDNHKVISNGSKIKVSDSESIDRLRGYSGNIVQINPQDVMDGLVIGDGTIHMSSLEKVYLIIGEDDSDYFDSEVKHLINGGHAAQYGIGFKVTTTIDYSELPKMWDRVVPDRFYYANENKVCGFLRGIFSANGCVNANARISFKTTSKRLAEQLRNLLSSIGIASYVTTNKSKVSTFANGDYKLKESYDINIPRFEDIILFKNKIGFLQKYKNEDLDRMISSKSYNKNQKTSYDIKSVETLGEEEVYDVTVSGPSHTYWTAGLNVSNCGEVPGNRFISTVCLLGSINLVMYVKLNRTFDWELFIKDVATFARMLDNINNLTSASLPQYEWAVKNVRQYGMGINGLGSALYMLGIKYGSKEALDFTEKINSLKEDITWETSAFLAEEKGVFPAFNEKFFETEWFCNFTKISPETKLLMKKYGVRNGKTTTNPPLGNSSVICDMVSNGIEPVFMHEYNRTYIADKWPVGLTKENVCDKLKEVKQGDATVWQGEYCGIFYHYEPHNRGLCIIEPVRDYGYQWVLDNYPEDIKNNAEYLITTEKLTIEQHVELQAVVQRNINQSVSKTANIPNDYPFEDFKRLYLNAWKMGLNGFTTYRDGSMESVLSKMDKNESENELAVVKKDIKLPDEFINGPMKIIKREGRKFYINFSYLPEDFDQRHPIVMWINTNNEGGDLVAVKQAVKKLTDLLRDFEIDEGLIERQLDKIKGDQSYKQLGKTISMCLRHNLPLVNIVVALENIEDDYISSLLTAVRKFLSAEIKDGTKISGKKCSVCESSNLIFESGCSSCKDCGASNCG